MIAEKILNKINSLFVPSGISKISSINEYIDLNYKTGKFILDLFPLYNNLKNKRF